MKLPSFGAFFAAIHPGRTPFPWQERLAQRVLDPETGWPSLLDLPTGAGKTSALDVALYALAAAPDRMPRRTILVIDRRIVVDQGALHAREVLAAMVEARDGPARLVADRLRSLFQGAPQDPPFAVAVLRGGMPRDNDWARRPDQPVIGVSTVDQVGSRLFFRGYGVNPRSASIHAGLLGNDTLLLLDEVHLAEPFAQTLAALQTRFRRTVPGLPDRFTVVRMSATPGSSPKDSFGLADDDRGHPVLSRRLQASKRAALRVVRVSGDDEAEKRGVLARAAVTEALALQERGARIVAIVVNRVDTARQARALLADPKLRTDALLVTGRMRPIDRDELVRDQLMPRCGPRDRREAPERPLVVVATQCIEAGADLDFDGLVTECASLDALRQRFGRLDRQGALGTTAAVILGRSDEIAGRTPDPVYGTALAKTWEWLTAAAKADIVDFGIADLPAPTEHGSARLDLLAPKPDAPILLPAHLDAWTQTAPVPDYEPDIALWLHGPRPAAADVQIVWRSDLRLPEPGETGEAATDPETEDLLERTIRLLSASRPSSLEALSVPLGAARRWLAGQTSPALADVIFTDDEDDPRSNKRPESPVVGLRWRGELSQWVRTAELRPGDVVVVPATQGGLNYGSYDPVSHEPVSDLGVVAALRGRGKVELRLHPDAFACLKLPAGQVPCPGDDETRGDFLQRLREWADAWPVDPPCTIMTAHEWAVLRDALRGHLSGRLEREPPVFLANPRRLRGEIHDAVTEDDDSPFIGDEVTLAQHSGDVEDFARRFAEALDLGPELAEDLALAGWLHDVGKADPRFQQWLVGGSEVRAALLPAPLAKSRHYGGSRAERTLAQRRAGYPSGYRHELLSLALVEASDGALQRAHDRDLVLHLVASHHGYCRPFAPFADHTQELHVSLRHGQIELAASTRHRRARLDSGVSDRFWLLVERYGWWGLAWLEAVIRLADHRASERSAGDPP